MMNAATYTVDNRNDFAALLSAYRSQRVLRAYGRLGQFGRVIVLADGTRIAFTAWTSRPPMNIHR